MYLDRIVATKREEVAKLHQSFSVEEALEKISALLPTRGFIEALSERRKRGMGLIAEVKKASPSKGLIRPDFDPVTIAKAYESAGADCLSVLTDEQYFQGSGEYLAMVREAVSLPLLRKDFIIDAAQIYEARLLGADAVLLIASILEPSRIAEFMSTASSIGLDCLIEVHNRSELDSVLQLESAKLVGVNNRNLHTFETSLSTTAELCKDIPEGVILISESGISGSEDISYLASTGAQGVLIGEHFMRKEDVEQAVVDLMGPLPQGQASDRGVY
ncbi:indole-3-glycerol phosphate synthase TrpC [Paenibacillus sp. N3/727]|uniref:indole-3-glycerol phosphate synthase TrpC n=1 Tax=Paenibacillus sp. N3/727 TaxID=2925845 RepID=UPI001F53B608|nr:indole-3-glycerol phosphate synthase TrpC [Paenibacillus sp. N3/727]UNK20526.1 indole-3-glycerol phosphate synthase TrpC [Paenibacillus sp. N3/727]